MLGGGSADTRVVDEKRARGGEKVGWWRRVLRARRDLVGSDIVFGVVGVVDVVKFFLFRLLRIEVAVVAVVAVVARFRLD